MGDEHLFRSGYVWEMRRSPTSNISEKPSGRSIWRSCIRIHELATSVPAAVLSAFAIIAVTILAVIFRQRRPLFVGWFWFLGTLVPMIGLVQIGVHAMADRYAYIPLLGIFVIVCWGAADLIKSWHVPTAVTAAGHGRHPAGAGNCASSAGRFLERQCHPLDPHSRNHRAPTTPPKIIWRRR